MCTAGQCMGVTPPPPPPPPVVVVVPPPPPPAAGHPAPACVGGQIGVAVHLVTGTEYSDEITWDIDSGPAYPQTHYTDNFEEFVDLCLPPGPHTINYFDAYV